MGHENYELAKSYLEATLPLRRTATPEMIALTILYFIEDAELVTGETLILDSGNHLGAKSTVSSGLVSTR